MKLEIYSPNFVKTLIQLTLMFSEALRNLFHFIRVNKFSTTIARSLLLPNILINILNYVYLR